MIKHIFLSKEELGVYSFDKKSVYAEEHVALHELNASNSFAVKFTYTTDKKAALARVSILKYIKAMRMPFDAIQRQAEVIVFKKGEN